MGHLGGKLWPEWPRWCRPPSATPQPVHSAARGWSKLEDRDRGVGGERRGPEPGIVERRRGRSPAVEGVWVC